jgi:hypothetical protein
MTTSSLNDCATCGPKGVDWVPCAKCWERIIATPWDEVCKRWQEMTHAPVKTSEISDDTLCLWVLQPITEMTSEEIEYWKQKQPTMPVPGDLLNAAIALRKAQKAYLASIDENGKRDNSLGAKVGEAATVLDRAIEAAGVKYAE